MTNSNDSNATRFLEIEEAATALIQQLQALESNVKSYSQVGDDLGKASQGALRGGLPVCRRYGADQSGCRGHEQRWNAPAPGCSAGGY